MAGFVANHNCCLAKTHTQHTLSLSPLVLHHHHQSSVVSKWSQVESWVFCIPCGTSLGGIQGSRRLHYMMGDQFFHLFPTQYELLLWWLFSSCVSRIPLSTYLIKNLIIKFYYLTTTQAHPFSKQTNWHPQAHHTGHGWCIGQETIFHSIHLQ